ncbi:MAG: ATP-binding protein [Actinomycetales bacterium]
MTRRASLARQVLAVQVIIGLVVVAVASAMAYRLADQQVRRSTRAEVLDVAHAFAATDDVRQGLESADPAAALGPLAERVRRETGTDFVVVLSPQGIRYTHPDPDMVGGTFVGTFAPAAAGGTIVEDYTGTLGPSTRAVVPVVDDNRVIGMVAVGVRLTRTEQAVRDLLPALAAMLIVIGTLSGLGAFWLARRVRSQTLGLNTVELQRMHDHHEAVLHAVREGLIIVGVDGRLQVTNDEACRLLSIHSWDVGRPIEDLDLSNSLVDALVSPVRRTDELHASGGRILVVSTDLVRRGDRHVATLMTLRDRTELEELTGQLSTVQELADALHAQAHESMNRLHTVVTMVELGRGADAVRFATDELHSSQQLNDSVVASVDDPAVAALLLGKIAQAGERGVRLELDPEAHLPGALPTRDVLTVLGNLLDNAIDAVAPPAELDDRTVVVDASVDNGEVVLTVADSGPGLASYEVREAFRRGWSSKSSQAPGGRGLGLALVQQTVRRLGGAITVSQPPGAVFTIRIPLPDNSLQGEGLPQEDPDSAEPQPRGRFDTADIRSGRSR